MSECQENFLRQEIKANLYLDSLVKTKTKLKENGQQHEIGTSTIQLSDKKVPSSDSSIESGENANPTVPVVINSDTHASANNGSLQSVIPSGSSCNFNIEKPKFSGDVREYVIFKSDFRQSRN